MSDKITIQDIARIAGVAKSTVSRYLNGGSVSSKTRLKIESVIQMHQYEPNAFAQSLKQQTTRTIGVIVPRLDSYAQTQMLKGMDNANQDDVFLIVNTYQDEQRLQKAIRQLANQRVSGLVIFASNLSESTQSLIKQFNIPTVIQGQELSGFHRVVVDDRQAGETIGELVNQQGSKSVLIVSVDAQRDTEIGAVRYEAICQTIKDASIETVFADFSLESAYEVTANFLQQNIEIDAIVAVTDLMAIGAMKAVEDAGLSIPVDVNIYGFGGTMISQLPTPNLTTYAFDYENVGQQLYTMLKDIQQNESALKRSLVGGHLKMGKSTS
jgi:LacI family sucrose operon transcriptional repressor